MSTSIPPSQKLTFNPPNVPLPPPCHLFKFPNELIVGTISWLPHPIDIISLSYTCKKFHNLLIDPVAAYVWRYARGRFEMIQSINVVKPVGSTPAACHVEVVIIPEQGMEMHMKIAGIPIPGPFEGQSEYALARMLFGTKRCQRCQKGYKGPPSDMVLRFTLCPDCNNSHRMEFEKEYLIDSEEAQITWLNLRPVPITIGPNTFQILWDAVLKERSIETFSYWTGYAGRRGGRASRRAWTVLLEEYVETKKMNQSSKIRHFLDVTLKKEADRVTARHKRAGELNQWYQQYRRHLGVIESGILKISELFASSHGLPFQDLQKAPAYRHAVAVAQRQFTINIMPFLIRALPELTPQTLKIQANRIDTSTGLAQKTRRKEIEAFYIQYKFPDDIKPTLDTFRAIPVLQALQRGISIAGVEENRRLSMPYYTSTRNPVSERTSIRENFKEKVLVDLVRVSIMQWRERAVLGARKLLGFEGYRRKAARRTNGRKNKAKPGKVDKLEPLTEERPALLSGLETGGPMKVDCEEDGEGNSMQKWHSVPGRLDPEMRVTSWFVCTRCTNMDPGYKRMRVLDFRGLCSHECWQKDWSKPQRKSWNIECFSLSPRAMDTAKRMVEILGLDAGDPKTTAGSLKGWWSCNNCPRWMSGMVWEDLLRHCQRHPTQEIAPLSDDEAQKRRDALGFKEKRLTFADLLSGKHDTEARIKQLACVHCRPTSGGQVGGQKPPDAQFSKTEKVMDIHGMRQHMKAKHHVSDCRNEDYYYVSDDRIQPNCVTLTNDGK